MRLLVVTALAMVVVALPRTGFAFAHGDVPNVANDKRGHEPPKENAKVEDAQGGKYHPPAKPKSSWWDNGGHEQRNDAYPQHHAGTSDEGATAHSPKTKSSGKVQHLEGGATVTDVTTPVRRKSSGSSAP